MTETFRAIRVSKTDSGQETALVEMGPGDLMEVDVTVAVDHSTVKCKDEPALTGTAPIVRVWPLLPGIDFAGRVETSSHTGFKPRRSRGCAQWLRCRREPSWRICAEDPRQGRLASEAAGSDFQCAGNDNRYGGIYGDAVRHDA